MHLSVSRCVALSAMLVLCGPFGQRAHAQSADTRTVTLRVAVDETYRARTEWETDLRKTVQAVSDIYEAQFQVRLVILDSVSFTASPQASLRVDGPLNRLDNMMAEVPIGEADLLVGFSGGSCADGAGGGARPFGRVAVVMARCHEGRPGNSDGAERVLSHEIGHLFGAFHPARGVQSVMSLTGGPVDVFDDQNARVIRLTRRYDFRGGILTLDEPTRRAWRAIHAEGNRSRDATNTLVAAFVNAGHELIQSGKWREGEAAIREAIKVDQYLAPPHAALAFILAQRGDFAEAIRELQRARSYAFTSASLRTDLGLLLFRVGRDDEALAELQIALAIQPDTPKARAGRCAVLQRRGKIDEAIRDCSEAIRLAPKEAAVLTTRGDLYRRKGDLDRAIEDYDAALRIDQQHTHAAYGRSCARQMKGDHAGAEADLVAARTMSPGSAE
jgi:tetratricopeptide (TPR) repeat protein